MSSCGEGPERTESLDFDPDHEWWSPTRVESSGHLTRLFEGP